MRSVLVLIPPLKEIIKRLLLTGSTVCPRVFHQHGTSARSPFGSTPCNEHGFIFYDVAAKQTLGAKSADSPTESTYNVEFISRKSLSPTIKAYFEPLTFYK